MVKRVQISLVTSAIFSVYVCAMGTQPTVSAKLRAPLDRSEINRFDVVRDSAIATERDSDIVKLTWYKDTNKELLELGKGIERQVWFGVKNQDPVHLEGVWLDNKPLFPEDYKRLESIFRYVKLDGNVTTATSMRRVATHPQAALTHFEYKGYLANGGGLNGKPTGLFHAFRSKEGKDFLILQEMDLKVTEGGIGFLREHVNARVNGRPASLHYFEQSVGAKFYLKWAFDGFFRQATIYCANTQKCDYKGEILKIASDWN